MIKSSLPESSPFTTTDLPMVATSWLRRLSLRVASGGRVGALRGGLKAGTGGPCSGPGVVCSSSLRFHILELHAVAATGQEASAALLVGSACTAYKSILTCKRSRKPFCRQNCKL